MSYKKPLTMIPETIEQHVNTPGLAVSFSSAGNLCMPKVGRAFSVLLNKEKNSVSFILPKIFFEPHLENVNHSGRLSLNITYPLTHNSFQFKGSFVKLEVATIDERSVNDTNLTAFKEILKQWYGEEAGKHFEKYQVDDLVKVEMNIQEVFDQTPGPGAGKKIFSLN